MWPSLGTAKSRPLAPETGSPRRGTNRTREIRLSMSDNSQGQAAAAPSDAVNSGREGTRLPLRKDFCNWSKGQKRDGRYVIRAPELCGKN